MDSSSSIKFQTLPPELHLSLSRYLTPIDLTSVSQTCHKLRPIYIAESWASCVILPYVNIPPFYVDESSNSFRCISSSKILGSYQATNGLTKNIRELIILDTLLHRFQDIIVKITPKIYPVLVKVTILPSLSHIQAIRYICTPEMQEILRFSSSLTPDMIKYSISAHSGDFLMSIDHTHHGSTFLREFSHNLRNPLYGDRLTSLNLGGELVNMNTQDTSLIQVPCPNLQDITINIYHNSIFKRVFEGLASLLKLKCLTVVIDYKNAHTLYISSNLKELNKAPAWLRSFTLVFVPILPFQETSGSPPVSISSLKNSESGLILTKVTHINGRNSLVCDFPFNKFFKHTSLPNLSKLNFPYIECIDFGFQNNFPSHITHLDLKLEYDDSYQDAGLYITNLFPSFNKLYYLDVSILFPKSTNETMRRVEQIVMDYWKSPCTSRYNPSFLDYNSISDDSWERQTHFIESFFHKAKTLPAVKEISVKWTDSLYPSIQLLKLICSLDSLENAEVVYKRKDLSLDSCARKQEFMLMERELCFLSDIPHISIHGADSNRMNYVKWIFDFNEERRKKNINDII